MRAFRLKVWLLAGVLVTFSACYNDDCCKPVITSLAPGWTPDTEYHTANKPIAGVAEVPDKPNDADYCFASVAGASLDSGEAPLSEDGSDVQVAEDVTGRQEQFESAFRAFSQSAALSVYGAEYRIFNKGLPKNARQTTEGYWLGGEPTPENIRELYAHGVRLILTAASVNSSNMREIVAQMKKLNITHVNIPFGGKFPNPSRFESKIQDYLPNQIYIHCEHGGDRSGAILAYLLVMRHQWSVPSAMLAVAFPGPADSKRLIHTLESKGYVVSDEDVERYLGIYSAELNGGYGGLKVRGEGYMKLVNTTIDTIKRSQKQREKGL